VLADLAWIEADPSLLDAARDVLAALSPALLPSNPDRERPALSVARAARALGQTYTLDVDGEEDELEVLLALGTSDERRVFALAASLEWPLWVVVRSRPELAQAAVQALVSMCDPDSIWREGCALLPWLGPPRVRSALDAILPHAPASLDAHADSWVSLLDVVARTGLHDLVHPPIDDWFARPCAELGRALSPWLTRAQREGALAIAVEALRGRTTPFDAVEWLTLGANLVTLGADGASYRSVAADMLPTLPPDSFDPILLEPHEETARASIVRAALTHARERLAARLG
jgi:hypothetical protein